MADFTDMFAQIKRDQTSVALLEELHRLREEKWHWDCESKQRREDIAELCVEVGRLQRENQLLRDRVRETPGGEQWWQEWLEATTVAAAKRLQRGQR